MCQRCQYLWRQILEMSATFVGLPANLLAMNDATRRESIGQLIRRLRAIQGLTQGQLATYANVGRSWLSLVEVDRIEQPDPDMLRRVARRLRVEPDVLLRAAGYDVDVASPPAPPPTTEELLREAAAAARREREAMEARIRELEAGRRIVRVPLVRQRASVTTLTPKGVSFSGNGCQCNR